MVKNDSWGWKKKCLSRSKEKLRAVKRRLRNDFPGDSFGQRLSDPGTEPFQSFPCISSSISWEKSDGVTSTYVGNYDWLMNHVKDHRLRKGSPARERRANKFWQEGKVKQQRLTPIQYPDKSVICKVHCLAYRLCKLYCKIFIFPEGATGSAPRMDAFVFLGPVFLTCCLYSEAALLLLPVIP